jgi:ABC-type glycerol-3-phosphate transport system substrate-binding protein
MGESTLDRRTFFKGAGLLGASVTTPWLLTACSGGGAAGDHKIKFWWNPSVESADQMTAWMNGVVKQFTAANKGTSIESTTQPAEQLASNFRIACQSKSGPDLQHEYSGPYTMQFVWERCIAPLDGLLDAEEFKHVLPPQALDIYKFRGKTWALPWYNAPIPLMYNKALFKKAGLDPATPPATMDELLTAAKALRKVGVTPWGYGVKALTGIGNFAGMFNTQNLNDAKELLPVVLGQQKYTEPKFSEWLT